MARVEIQERPGATIGAGAVAALHRDRVDEPGAAAGGMHLLVQFRLDHRGPAVVALGLGIGDHRHVGHEHRRLADHHHLDALVLQGGHRIGQRVDAA